MNEIGWRTSLPPALMLLMQVALYVWMAPHGFDFTDESYYFLSYLYWHELLGTTSFFGAYFELPFRLLGERVSAIRIFSLLILLASSAFFVREVLRYASRRETVTGTIHRGGRGRGRRGWHGRFVVLLWPPYHAQGAFLQSSFFVLDVGGHGLLLSRLGTS